MKKFIFTLLFSTLVFSSPSYAGWTKVDSVGGDTHYVDLDRIRKHDGYVYYWWLGDLLKPIVGKYFSIKSYVQGDCKVFRYKSLSQTLYIEPMGNGTSPFSSNTPEEEWLYPEPDSSGEFILKFVCSH
jgi:hypothetical protein